MPEQLRLFSPSIIPLGRGLEKMKRLDFEGAKKEFEEALISREFSTIAQSWKRAAEYWLGGLKDIDLLLSPGDKCKKWYDLWDKFVKEYLPWREQIFADMRQQVFGQIMSLWQADPIPLPYPIGYFQLETGDLQGAIISLEGDLKRELPDPLTQLLLANAYYCRGEISKAAGYYREALFHKPLNEFQIEIKHPGLRNLWEEFEDEGLEWVWFPVYAALRGVLPLPSITSWDQAREIEACSPGWESEPAGLKTNGIANKAKLFLAYLQSAHWYRKHSPKEEIECRRKMKSLNSLLFEFYLERL